MPLPIPPFIPFDARDKFYNAKEGIYRFKNAELEGVARLHRYNDTCMNSYHTRTFVHESEIPPRLKVGSYARLDAVDEKLCNVGGKLSKKKDLGSTKEKLANSMCRTNRRIDKTLHDAQNEIYWVKTGVKMSEQNLGLRPAQVHASHGPERGFKSLEQPMAEAFLRELIHTLQKPKA